jgi:hypothetical protein
VKARANQNVLPALYGAPEFAEAGGLVSVSQERADQHFRPPMSVAGHGRHGHSPSAHATSFSAAENASME